MSEYAVVKTSKLQLKGQKRKKKQHREKAGKVGDDRVSEPDVEDSKAHGGWFTVSSFEHVTGSIAFEMAPFSYMRALDNGLFIASAPHHPGEGPDREEVITAIRVSDTKIALKSGYNKYLSIDQQDRLVGRSDAIGTKEQFEPVFQEGKIAISGYSGCFLSPDDEKDGLIFAKSKVANAACFLKIRSRVDPDQVKLQKEAQKVPTEEKGSVEDCEINYVKKYQSFQDKKLRMNNDDKTSLQSAQREGRLHETLLDRRAKMKSDKFCK